MTWVVVLFADSIKSNISTRKRVTRILLKKLYCYFNWSSQYNTQNAGEKSFHRTKRRRELAILVSRCTWCFLTQSCILLMRKHSQSTSTFSVWTQNVPCDNSWMSTLIYSDPLLSRSSLITCTPSKQSWSSDQNVPLPFYYTE